MANIRQETKKYTDKKKQGETPRVMTIGIRQENNLLVKLNTTSEYTANVGTFNSRTICGVLPVWAGSSSRWLSLYNSTRKLQACGVNSAKQGPSLAF